MADSEYARRRAELPQSIAGTNRNGWDPSSTSDTVSAPDGDADDGDFEVQYRIKPTATSQPIPLHHRCPPAAEQILAHYDEFGTTPPRTRIKNKSRDWDRRLKVTSTDAVNMRPMPDKNGDGARPCPPTTGGRGGRCSRNFESRINRRNTVDCAILAELYFKDETAKRSKQLLRESERDVKRASMVAIGGGGAIGGLACDGVAEATNTQMLLEERAESFPVCGSNTNYTLNQLIKCNSKFKSVISRPAGCRTSAPAYAFQTQSVASAMSAMAPEPECPSLTADRDRRNFHETFANLIKLGSDNKVDNKTSNEIDTWQTELKDMIWLELQAWQAERTLEEQDHFLFASRKDIPQLLNKILHYRFKPTYSREESVTSSDSGISSASESKDMSDMMASISFDEAPASLGNCSESNENLCGTPKTPILDDQTACKNCLSLYCKRCQVQQGTAMREVEELLTRLEDAEMLYPSSKVMGNYHPIYKSEEFVGRVKAMCLWYNLTKFQRMKMALIGVLFRRLHGKSFQWPEAGFKFDPHFGSASSSSAQENEDSGRDSIDSRKLHRSIPRVKFTVDGDDHETTPSPPDSASSSDSSKEPIFPLSADRIQYSSFAQFINDVQQFQLDPTSHQWTNETSTNEPVAPIVSPYRKYIEHVMKTRGLGKSLSFLHRMHNVIIRKVQFSLEKSDHDDDSEFDAEIFDDQVSLNETPIDLEQEVELRRYGVWSKEARSLGLPSYAPTFVFLSVIPLEIMHEYLRLRLEARPQQPDPLSLEQLMKEVREGLILGMTHRERFNKHIHTALEDHPESLEKYMKVLREYDATVREVLALYFSYVEHWVLKGTPIELQKTAVAKEWSFAKLMAPMIPGQHSVAAEQFCHIISQLMQNISQRLLVRSKQHNDQIKAQLPVITDHDRTAVLMVCRDIQSMFSKERENAMGLLNFAKILCRDLELKDFHRDHALLGADDEHIGAGGNDDSVLMVCERVKTAVRKLQCEVLTVRDTLTQIIQNIKEKCQEALKEECDDPERLQRQTRAREILQQSFKFGFDYHKELVRLFDTKIVSCKDKSCEFNLSQGIIQFARLWMHFVTTTCERGRGVRPRWAATGLDFLISACDPVNTKHLDDKDFKALSAEMDACITHVVGIVSKQVSAAKPKRDSPRSRKISPSARPILSPRIISEEQKFYKSQISFPEEPSRWSSAPNSPRFERRPMQRTEPDSPAATLKVPKANKYSLAMRRVRIRDKVNQLDLQLDQKWRSKNLIGQVKALNACDKTRIRSRSVNFKWHRGNKIGQGRFGKVYTAVNNLTGELMAMKEITIQANETAAIQNVAKELQIFEGISHKYLVKYYGVEVHREELLIFMELCAEGTLESLVEGSGSLHEGLNRRFTAQLLTAVQTLHKHGVVHRDIKTANIFLTNGGNSLKLGDFGSAVKIQAHTTVPGELRGYVGTQAYMAPEVFTKTNTDGHGRAADIWSAGCVTIEMASGKRPWAQYDSNFQIMFKVGMGETPEAPADLSTEGHDFLEHCLEHDPLKRWNATKLLDHHFCKVALESDGGSPTLDKRREQRKTSLHRK